MTWNKIGLIIFVAIAVGTLLVLLWDWYRDVRGLEMITTYLQANPWAAYLVLMGECAGVMGLAVHLMAPVPIDYRH